MDNPVTLHGDLIDEIRSLPDKNIFHHILTDNENQYNSGVITEENFDYQIIKLILDYYNFKQQQKKNAETIPVNDDSNKKAEYWSFENFEVGQVFSGGRYKSNLIRTAIDITTGKPVIPQKGKSREAQIKQFHRALELLIQPNRIKVIDIKDELEDLVDKRKQKIGAYRIPLKAIILYRLLNADDLMVKTNITRFIQEIIKMTLNPAFDSMSIKKYCQLLPNINEKDIDFIINDNRKATYNSLRRNFYTALQSLEESDVIGLEKYYVVYKGKEKLTSNGDDDYLGQKIKAAEKYCMSQIIIWDKEKRINRPIQKKHELFKYQRWDEYKEIFDDYVIKKHKWNKVYQEIRIFAISREELKEEISKLCTQVKHEYTLDDFYNDLNKAVCQSIIQRSKKRKARFDERSKLINSELGLFGCSLSDYNTYDVKRLVDCPIVPEQNVSVTELFVEKEIKKG